MDNGNDTTAERLFKEEIQINPYCASSYSNLGHILFTQTKYEEAEQLMRKALSLSEEDAVFENDLAACIATEKKYAESIEICIKILQRYPTYEYPKKYINQIFLIWDDKEKVAYYKSILNKKKEVL